MLAEFQFQLLPQWNQGKERRKEKAYSDFRHIRKLPLATELLLAVLLQKGQKVLRQGRSYSSQGI